ncbi:hypothetical protein C8R45DRAFT_1106333 [Mycena sanguinolenta]|nr:hypothetical protein C8R45DRAFT_1106333 [Mycena sanguinolenta]
MQQKIPHEEWKDPAKWDAADAVWKYAETTVNSRTNVQIRLLESDVDANADVYFVIYFYSSWRPSEPKAPEWLSSVARILSEFFAELGWEAPEAKWYMHSNMGAYEDSRDFNY